MKFRVIHEPEVCLGCGACVAVCPKNWEMASNGKSHLKGSETKEQNELNTSNVKVNEVLDIDEKERECNQQAADVCPVSCIHIKELPKERP